MQILRTEVLPIKTQNDIVGVRQKLRDWAVQQKFSLVEQTKIITAGSELARNTLDYGRGGELTLELVSNGVKTGLRLTFSDKGPGIVDLSLALTDGYTTGKGLGLGLSGSRRLMNEFEIHSTPGEGTRVIVTKWK